MSALHPAPNAQRHLPNDPGRPASNSWVFTVPRSEYSDRRSPGICQVGGRSVARRYRHWPAAPWRPRFRMLARRRNSSAASVGRPQTAAGRWRDQGRVARRSTRPSLLSTPRKCRNFWSAPASVGRVRPAAITRGADGGLRAAPPALRRLRRGRGALSQALDDGARHAVGISPDNLAILVYETAGENISFGRGQAQRADIARAA